jgi:hypothetical protein
LVLVRKAVRALVNQHVIGDAFDGKEQASPSEKADALEVLFTFINYVCRVLLVIAFSFYLHPMSLVSTCMFFLFSVKSNVFNAFLTTIEIKSSQVTEGKTTV